MADRSTGPVKPPVIDLTARSGGTARADSDRSSAAGRGSTDSRPTTRFDLGDGNWPLIGGAAVGGAVLGTILTYLLAFVVPLPSHVAPAPDLSPLLTAQTQRMDTLEAELAAATSAAADTQKALDTAAGKYDAAVANLGQQIADTRAAIPAPTSPVDLTPLQTEFKTLKAQVDAIAAGASGADAGAIAQSLSGLETALNSVTTRLNGVDQTVAALRTDIDATRKTLADHITAALPNEVGPALKLPLILSGLEGAFANGRPFADELASLATVLPDFAVPGSLTGAAASGLSRPDTLMQHFEAALPDILAARGNGTGDWAQGVLDWAKSLLALRPAEEIEGDSPEAIVSRIEAAMARRDYSAARTLIGQLPPSMQTEAAPIAADIAVHADADKLIGDLRAKALAGAEMPR